MKMVRTGIRLATVAVVIALCALNAAGDQLNHRELAAISSHIRLFFDLTPYTSIAGAADYWRDGVPYKELYPDTASLFRGYELVPDSSRKGEYIRTCKIGLVWAWSCIDQGRVIHDDAVYMSLWDHSPEFPDSQGAAIDVEIVKVDAGDSIRHLMMIDGVPVARITWERLGRNNPYWYRWWVQDRTR